MEIVSESRSKRMSLRNPIPQPQPGGVAAYADMVIARGPDVIKTELIRVQSKIMTAQQALQNGDPMAAARALRS
jgi:hypothetical protein